MIRIGGNAPAKKMKSSKASTNLAQSYPTISISTSPYPYFCLLS